MKKNFKLQSTILIMVTILISCNQNTELKFHQLKGPYLGQNPPFIGPLELIKTLLKFNRFASLPE